MDIGVLLTAYDTTVIFTTNSDLFRLMKHLDPEK